MLGYYVFGYSYCISNVRVESMCWVIHDPKYMHNTAIDRRWAKLRSKTLPAKNN